MKIKNVSWEFKRNWINKRENRTSPSDDILAFRRHPTSGHFRVKVGCQNHLQLGFLALSSQQTSTTQRRTLVAAPHAREGPRAPGSSADWLTEPTNSINEILATFVNVQYDVRLMPTHMPLCRENISDLFMPALNCHTRVWPDLWISVFGVGLTRSAGRLKKKLEPGNSEELFQDPFSGYRCDRCDWNVMMRENEHRILRHLQFFAEISWKLLFFQSDFLRKFWDCSGAKGCKSCRAWKMLSNAYFLAKFRFDTAENEPAKNLQNFRKMHFRKMHFRKMHFSKMHFRKMHFSKILQIFGGLVLGCIKTKFCKKICVRQHFSSSTRFASFCTAAISKF